MPQVLEPLSQSFSAKEQNLFLTASKIKETNLRSPSEFFLIKKKTNTRGKFYFIEELEEEKKIPQMLTEHALNPGLIFMTKMVLIKKKNLSWITECINGRYLPHLILSIRTGRPDCAAAINFRAK